MATTPTPAAVERPFQHDPLRAATCCRRRTVLRAAGLVALSSGAAALAACSADATSATGGAAPERSASETPSTSSGSAPASESPSAAGGSGAIPEGTVVAVSEVAVGGGLVVEQKYVVTQPSAGEFKAFSAICTHQGCPVASVEDGQIICPCHNSHFDITTGAPSAGPAQQPLPAVAFTKSGDDIVVTG